MRPLWLGGQYPRGARGRPSLTSMRKSPVRSPALQATPSTSTDSRYWSAGKAGVGVNSSMGVSAVGRGGGGQRWRLQGGPRGGGGNTATSHGRPGSEGRRQGCPGQEAPAQQSQTHPSEGPTPHPTRKAPTPLDTLSRGPENQGGNRTAASYQHPKPRTESRQGDRKGVGSGRGAGARQEASRGEGQGPSSKDTLASGTPPSSLPLAPRSTKPKPSWSRFCRTATLSSMT